MTNTTSKIVGFHQDDEGDWIAELSCGHCQHVRHRPPFVERPWVLTEAGRAARIGATVECPKCAALAGSQRSKNSSGL
jgi:Protein of unknown function (DUF3565)